MKDVFYQLTTDDVQFVAMEKIGRKLSESEMIEVSDMVTDGIVWYDIIAISINELVHDQKPEAMDTPN